ncbi:MAG: glycosyltransferase family 4 protein [FCB group bacterium]|nr:glycosyltransferase family 4 protein [FCB group bacterium]
MKVVVITHNYIRRHGDLTALYLHRLSSGLTAKGIELTVVCPHAPGLLRRDTIDGVRIIRFSYPFSTHKPIVYTGNMHQEVAGSVAAKAIFAAFLNSFYFAARRVCRQVRPDVIWANWWIPPGMVAARISASMKIPLVISSHGTDIALLKKRGIFSTLSSYVYARTAKASVVSNFLKETLTENVTAISPDDVAVIPMPVGMEHFPKTVPPENDIPVFLSVARFSRQKRLDDIIAAAEKIIAKLASTERPPFKVVMVGEGPLENELKEIVQSRGLNDIFDFIPLVAQQRLGELYRQSDAVILSSENEGFGLVLVEAGLTSRPLIGARSGGIIDVINDGENGLLYEVGDVEGLARCMTSLIESPARRAALGEGGYVRAMENFATPVLVDKIYDLFQAVVGDKTE